MIISFKNINGGGGGGYVLPTATPTRLGGVKIGDGINVDSAGTISVSGSDVANYAMALKNLNEGDGDYRVVNDNGRLYYVEDYKTTEGYIFVKVKYDADYVTIDMNIDGQTDTNIMALENSDFRFIFSIDSEGNLFYVDENDEKVYYDSEVEEYQYGDFTFSWVNDGTYIEFPQQAQRIEVDIITMNCEIWHCVGQDMLIANEDQLGLVKIGEGIDLAEDGTISVSGGGGGIEVVTELPASGTDGQMVMLVKSYEGGEEIIVRGDTANIEISATAKSITEKTKLWTFQHWNDRVDINANADGTIEANSTWHQTTYTFSGSGTFMMDDIEYGGGTVEVTVTKVAEGEWLFTCESPVERYDIHSDVIPPTTEYKLYKWSDEETPSIDAVISNDGYMVEIFYENTCIHRKCFYCSKSKCYGRSTTTIRCIFKR